MNQFSIVNSLDQKRWNKFVYEHPKGSVFHTSYMVDVFRWTKRHHPLFLAAIDKAGDVLALLVAVRVQTLPDPLGNLSSRSVFYAEPLCREDAPGAEALQVLLAAHDAEMQNKVLFTEIRLLWAVEMERTALECCGYEYEDYLNFLTDLRKPKDKLWQLMAKPCKRHIRHSWKQGVKVEEATTAQGVEILYRLLQLTYERAKIPLADKSLFAVALTILQPHDMIKIFVTYYEETPMAAQVVLLYKKTIYAWYGGAQRIESVSPMECMTWHQLEWGQQQGYELYDYGGAGRPNIPYRVRDFKAKFGGELVNYGRYRKIYSPWKLMLAEKAYEIGRNILNPQSWTRP